MTLFSVDDKAEVSVGKSLTTTDPIELIGAGNNAVTLHQINVANISGSAAVIDLYIEDAAATTYLTKGESVSANTRLEIDRNIRINPDQSLKAKSGTAGVYDVLVTYMQSPQRAR